MTFAQQRVIGRYVLGEAIAAGGMATVCFGRLLGPAGFSRTVAIKQLRPELSSDEDSLATFLDEARLASRIHHPNVVSPLDVVLLGNEAFIVMEYVHGESLAHLLKARPGSPVPPALAAGIIGQVLLGLHAAHRAVSEDGAPLELVHRDVSPQNILITQAGVARLLDFGIAKAVSQSHHTVNGVLKGKLAYMTPEQVTASPLDRRTDLFAVGTVLWEMLTGQRLFLADTPAGCAEKILHGRIPAPSEIENAVPPELDAVVLKALAREPGERFGDAQEMAMAVTDAVRPAGSLELGTWVSERCEEVLVARAKRIAKFEAAPLEELTLGLPASGYGFNAPKASQPPRTDNPGESSRRRLSERREVVISAAVLALALLSAAGTQAVQRMTAKASLDGAVRPALREEPALAKMSRPLEAMQSVPSAGGNVAAPVQPEARRSVPQSRQPPRREGSRAQRMTDVQPRIPAPKAVLPSKQVRERSLEDRAPACDLPFSIDERGVKRFNPDCL